MKIFRRFFLGGLAAVGLVRPGAAPAQPIAPVPPAFAPVPSPTGCWQDIARQIPAIKVGDPVAYVDGVAKPLIQPDPACRPTLGTHWEGQHYIEFNGREQYLWAEDTQIPKPLIKAGPGAKVFEVRVSSSTSAQALATTEQDMMRKWIQ